MFISTILNKLFQTCKTKESRQLWAMLERLVWLQKPSKVYSTVFRNNPFIYTFWSV